MPTKKYPRSARRYHAFSALAARRAAREAVQARPGGFTAVAGIVVAHQVLQAREAQIAVDQMLFEQEIDAAAEAILNLLSFTTAPTVLRPMLDDVDTDAEFARLVESIVQDAGRAAESVSIATRPNIGHVRFLTLPSCSRCAVLAGRVYRYSDGFLRHPNCDCVMIPTTLANPDLVQDPAELLREGQIRGLSQADTRAVLDDEADFGQVVNVRRRAAGLTESGRVLARAGKPTPEGIYRAAKSRDDAVQNLLRHGYIAA